MKVVNKGPERVYLAASGDFVDPGEEVEVPDADGASLIAQGWGQPKPPAKPKTPPSKED